MSIKEKAISLGFADAAFESRSGFIRSCWRYSGDNVIYEFEIPEGVTAFVKLPSGKNEKLGGGKYVFTEKTI